jgi:protein-arginine kinase activator protein McsA
LQRLDYYERLDANLEQARRTIVKYECGCVGSSTEMIQVCERHKMGSKLPLLPDPDMLVCKECGITFRRMQYAQKYCSAHCQAEFRRTYMREYMRRRRHGAPPCKQIVANPS